MKKLMFILLNFVLCTNLTIAQKIPPTQVFQLDNIFQSNKSIKNTGWKSKAQYFNFNRQVYESLKNFKGSKATFNLQLEANKSTTVDLDMWSPHSDDFIITTSDGKKLSKNDMSKAFYFKGHIQGQPNSFAAISVFENEVIGMVSTPNGNYNIGVLDRSSIQKNGELHTIYNDLTLPKKNPFECHTPDIDFKEEVNKNEEFDNKSLGCRIVNNYFEIDNQGYIQNGSNITTTTNYVNGVFNIVKLLYARDLIQVNLSQLYIWTTLDPYPGTSSDAALTAFRTRIQSITYNGNIAHLMSLKVGNLGGLAYLNSLCSSTSATNIAFSNVALNYSQFPIYSWTVNVVAHEIGHNLGSNHTHWCGWLWPDGTRRPIDFCGTVEPFGSPTCYTGARIPQSGTIMSYCHTNGSIDFTQGFGPLPSTLMRSRVSTATCLTGYQIENYSITGTRRVCVNGTINLGVTGITDATYLWTGPNGFTSTNPSISVTNASASTVGTYNVAVTKNGCTHTGKNAIVRLNGNASAPFSQNFEPTTSIPTGWEVINPNGDNTWSVTSLAGGFGTSSNSIRAMNYPSPNSIGRLDSLFTPVVALGSSAASQLRFDVSYAQYTGRADTLTILASVNCSNTYQVVFKKGGAELATAPSLVSSFTPTASQWRTENINLSSLSSASSIQFIFVSRSAYGNYIYLDNINMIQGGVQPPTCTFTYGNWTACSNGTQTRTFTSSPTNCTGTPPADSLTRSCSVIVPCVFTYSAWSTCSNGIQSRTVTSNPPLCSGVAPFDSLTRTCVVPPVVSCTLRDITKPTNTITAIGTTSPLNEEVFRSIDNLTSTKYLNFQGANSGLTINTDTSAIVKAITLTSANDVPSRDPSTYQLFGSTNGITFTLISSGSVPLFTARFQKQTIDITNQTAYQHYRLIFPSVIGANCENCSVMQIAELELLACTSTVVQPPTCTFTYSNWTSCSNGTQTRTFTSSPVNCIGTPPADSLTRTCVVPPLCATLIDVTLPTDPIVIVNGVRTDSRNSPTNEEVFRAIDNNFTTKYLNFKGAGSGFIVDINRTHLPIKQISLVSGNDEVNRDPTRYELFGSNDNITFDYIWGGAIPNFTSRRQKVTLPEFTNTVTYRYYRIVFPTLRGSTSTTFFQISEVELLACQQQTQAMIIYPNPTDGYFRVMGAEKMVVESLIGTVLKTFNTDEGNVSELKPGLYIINVDNVRKQLIKK